MLKIKNSIESFYKQSLEIRLFEKNLIELFQKEK